MAPEVGPREHQNHPLLTPRVQPRQPIEGGADVRLTNPHWRAQSDVAALSKFAALWTSSSRSAASTMASGRCSRRCPRPVREPLGARQPSFLQSHPDAHQTGAHGHVRAAFGIDESADSAGGANLDSPGMELMRRVVAAYWRDYMLFEDVLPVPHDPWPVARRQ